ncbi:NAD(P)H-binding protein [Cupriavidus sp. D384]|uniref:NAD(P)H-binding protein n=1 Tax=Cupriavidus sp. D384 TaxID=1538095 RepID=UPI000836DA57|nr:NAD(P)H-binding protein [Cupriavidus sp. D384]
MQTQNLLVTGVSGHYGRLAATHLVESHPAGWRGTTTLIGTTRTPSQARDLARRGVDVRPADFDQPSGLNDAFAGADRLLLTSTAAEYAGARRVQQHRHAIAAARNAGVGHIVYASFMASADSPLAALAADHVATEQALRAAGIGHTVLRHAFYMEMVLATARRAIASGVLRTLNAHAGVAYVARADCALAGACALRADIGASGAFVDITGPQAVTPIMLARAIHACLGIEIKVDEVSEDVLRTSLVAGGLPDPVAGMLVYLERGMAQGAMQAVSADFRRLTGREPGGVEAFLMQHREALAPNH